MNDFYEIISEIFLEKSRPSLYEPRCYLHGTPGITAVMGCGDHPNHRYHYLERVFPATTLDITMTYFTK
jgi:hypothetical protein